MVLTSWLALSLAVRGDGAIINKKGRYVPEHEQQAVIEWRDGQERLYVATRAAPVDGPSLWMVPVRASPARVRAEPAEQLPRVFERGPVVKPALKRLEEAMILTGFLDTGLFPYCGEDLLLSIGFGLGGEKSAGKKDVEEFQRVEQLGMVVVVLSVRSPEALDRYLAANGVDARATDLSALKPYFGSEEYALVCAWAAQAAEKVSARALRIDFPSPVVFYPLRPTRVYEADVQTALFVRGLMRPVKEGSFTGLRCRYLEGGIEEPGAAPGGKMWYGPITRIELTSPPASWDQDLVLEAGAPPAINAALFLTDLPLAYLWVAWAVLGAVLATFLPWAVLPRGTRRLTDWGWATVIGASICLTVYAAAMVFVAWRWRTALREEPHRERPGGGMLLGVAAAIGLLLVAEQIAIFIEFFAPGVRFDPGQGFAIPAWLFGFLGVPCFYVSLVLGLVRAGIPMRLGWFALFVALHCGVACGVLGALRAWIALHG
ncbi:MAG: hypothetical protein HYS12_16060 [Planctomycetes bacterium]|nr:hypothetical protein [Planctomycetota bacterium]